jgi:hypothetical protein
MIDLYNERTNSIETKIGYSIKSLSSKKLSRIVIGICELIERHNLSFHWLHGSITSIDMLSDIHR